MRINIELDIIKDSDVLTSTFTEDEAVLSIIQDALASAENGDAPEPRDIWIDIAATLGISV